MLESGVGVWSPIEFVIAFLAIAIAVYIMGHALFNSSHKKGMQQKPFFCGNVLPVEAHFPASGLFWGFTQGLKPYYDLVVPGHTGNINDYMSWFVVVAAVMMIVLGVLA